MCSVGRYNMRFSLTTMLVVALAATAVYLGSYFITVRPGSWVCSCGLWCAIEEYPRHGPFTPHDLKVFYAVANGLDRKLFRPSTWSGSVDFYGTMNKGSSGPQTALKASPPNQHLQAAPP